MPGSIGNLGPYLPSSYYDDGQLTTSDATAQQVAAAVQADAQTLPPAAQPFFLQMVQDSTDLAPGADGGPPADLNAALSRMENAAETLADCLSLAQGPAELAILLVESTYETQRIAMQEAQNASELQIAEAYAQASEDMTGAQALESAAVTTLVLAVVASVADAVGSLIALGGSLSMLRDISDLESNLDGIEDETSNLDTDIDVVGGRGSGEPGETRNRWEPTRGPEGGRNPNDPDEDNPNLDGSNNRGPRGDNSPNNRNPVLKTGNDDDDSGDPIADALEHETRQNRFQIRLERIRAKTALFNAFSQLTSAEGQAYQAGGNYASTMAQATNQIDQAQGQQYAAQQQYAQQFYNTAIGIVTSLQSFVEAEEQALNGILQGLTGESAAVVNARATV